MRNALILCLSFSLGVVAGCSSPEGDAATANPGESGAQEVGKVINVEVTILEPTSFEDYIRLTGVVNAEQDAILSADEGGRIERFFAEKGSQVRRSQPLVQIDDRILKAAVTEAEADSILRAEQLERQAQVWLKERIGTEINYLQAKQNASAAAARLQGLRARLDNTVIRAPFNGILEDRFYDEGEMAPLAAPVVRVINTETLKIECGVPERFAADVEVGSRAIITFDVLPEREFVAEVSFVGRAVDPGSRTFPIEVKLRNPESFVKPEMVANVRVVRTSLEAAIVVPQEALIRTEDGYVVFVASEGERGPVAEQRRVVPGPSYANRVAVAEGLEPGDRLITVGQTLVAAGNRITIVNEPTESTTTAGMSEGTEP